MKHSLGLVVLLVALATGSVFAQSAGQIQIWVNGATPAPQRLRFTAPPGRVLPAVKNCHPQFNNGGNSSADKMAALAFLLQVLADGGGSSFGGLQPSYGYGQNSGYGNGFSADDLALAQIARDRAVNTAEGDVVSAQQDLNEAIAAPLGNCQTASDIALARIRRNDRILSAKESLIRAQQELRRVQSGF